MRPPDDKVYRKSLRAAESPGPSQARASAADAGSASSVAVNQLDLTGMVAVGSAKATKSVTAAAADVSGSEKAKACRAAMGNTPWDNYGWTKKGPV